MSKMNVGEVKKLLKKNRPLFNDVPGLKRIGLGCVSNELVFIAYFENEKDRLEGKKILPLNIEGYAVFSQVDYFGLIEVVNL